ncbi:MAG: DUF3800 domain-containing protein [Desulfobacterales bacterium]|nr:DUF3800 domain-containing protein [Desulfobacterales bacterium]
MNLYLDESGDLGWTFDKPYRAGGSSRYLTIATLIIPKNLSHLPKRIVKKIYRSRNQSTARELKGKDLSKAEKQKFVSLVIALLKQNPSIQISVITVKKENVQDHIRIDANKLYNYMVNFAVLDKIKAYPAVNFIPDPRAIKVASGNSLVDYLQVKLWFELNVRTTIFHTPMESGANLNLQFVDFISHIVWSRYENNDYFFYKILRPFISEKPLFF